MTEVRTVAEEAIIKVKNLQVEFDTDYKYRLRILRERPWGWWASPAAARA